MYTEKELQDQCDKIFAPSEWRIIHHAFREAYPESSKSFYVNALDFLIKTRTKKGSLTPGEVIEIAPKSARGRFNKSKGIKNIDQRIMGHVYSVDEEGNQFELVDMITDCSDGEKFYNIQQKVSELNRSSNSNEYILRICMGS